MLGSAYLSPPTTNDSDMPPAVRPVAPHRALIALLLLVLAAPLALAGCGSDGTAAADSSQTRTITDAEGTRVDVPMDPERVVTLSEPTLDGTLALGVTPVGSIAGRGQSGVPGYLADLAGDVPVLGSVSELDYEAIAKVKPDLILVDGTSVNSADTMKILRKIAPTVYAGYAGGDWHATLGVVADALNREGKEKEVVADYDAKVAAAKKKLTKYAHDTFSIVRWQGGSASLILKELPAGMALTDLGLRRPADQDRNGGGHSEPVSLENLDQIDADHMFFGTLGGSSEQNPNAGGTSDVTGAKKALAEAEKVPGFTDLTAYKNHQVIPVDGSLWTSTGGPILMSRLIDSVVESLT